MENQPIDPLLKKQYDEQLARDAADKAKALMEQPDHELVELENPDRLAERKTRIASEDYNTMKPFYDDEITTMRSVKNAIDRSSYAEEVGLNPDTFIGHMRPGKINKLVGDSDDSLFNNGEVEDIKNLEEAILSEAEQSEDKFIDNLPKGDLTEPFDKNKFKRDLYGVNASEEIYDQDQEQDNGNPRVA